MTTSGACMEVAKHDTTQRLGNNNQANIFYILENRLIQRKFTMKELDLLSHQRGTVLDVYLG